MVVVVVVVKTLFKHAKPHQLKVGFHIKGRAAKCLTNYNKHIINSNKVIITRGMSEQQFSL